MAFNHCPIPNTEILYKDAKKYSIVYGRAKNCQTQGKFLEKITVSKNKLCNIFVVNDRKYLSEIRQSWLYNSVTLISC